MTAFRDRVGHGRSIIQSLADRTIARLRAVRQPWTTTSISVLLVAGLVAVISQPRPRAAGLARLLLTADLLQSFPVDRSQPVPELWVQRLGTNASTTWQRSSGSWWQLWSAHDDGGAFLVVQAADLPQASRPATALAVDDLVVIAPDLLAARGLRQPLRQSHQPLAGLEQRCLQRLQDGQAVYWSGQGLAGLLGPLTPLMLHWQQGCLSLQLSSDQLSWEGESSGVAGVRGSGPERLPERRSLALPELPSGTLLAIRGGQLDLLLGPLLRRALVRDAMSSIYGLDADTLAGLVRRPFELRLRTLPKGPFRLGLTIQIDLAGQRTGWIRSLDQLSYAIARQGLRAMEPMAAQGGTLRRGRIPSDRTWKRADGAVVGGWRWIFESTRGRTRTADPKRLVLFIGPPPPSGNLLVSDTLGIWSDAPRPGQIQMLMRPKELAAEQIMPAGLPPLIHAAASLELVAGDPRGTGRPGEISPVRGGLRLTR